MERVHANSSSTCFEIGDGSHRVSAVIPAYNEERNIERMLTSLLEQRLTLGTLGEVVVVSSGSTDGTEAIVREVARRERRVRVLRQDVRLGKAAALNAYLRERDPSADVILITSADLLLQPGFLELLLKAFDDPAVGMCGGRPVPINSRDTLMGRVVHVMWELHHEVNLIAPKLGEAVAIRASVVDALPEDSPVDEASLEAQVHAKGLRLCYVPEAVLANRGPDSAREFLRQRRRIAAGHYWLRETTGYAVSTLDLGFIAKLGLRFPKFTDPAHDLPYAAAAAMELVGRAFGYFDLKRGYSHAIWKIAPSAHAALERQAPERAVPPPSAKAANE